MKKIVSLLLFACFISLSVLSAQSFSVGFTNKLIAAKTSDGYCFAFIFDNRVEFVKVISNGRGKEFQKPVKMTKSSGDIIEDAFFVGQGPKYFVAKIKGFHYFYVIAELLDPQYDGDTLSDHGYRSLQDIDAVYLYQDCFYYTKKRDAGLYKFQPGNPDRNDTIIDNIASSTEKKILYIPMTELREQQFASESRKIDGIISGFDKISMNIKPDDIENELIKTVKIKNPDVNTVYNNVKDNVLLIKFGYNAADFNRFRILGNLLKDTKTNTVNNSLNRIKNTNNSDILSIALITDFNIKMNKYNDIKTNDEKERRLQVARDKINAQEKKLVAEWGEKYSDKYNTFNSNKEKLANGVWVPNKNDRIAEINANKQAIIGNNNILFSLLSDRNLSDKSRYIDSNDYQEYSIVYQLFIDSTEFIDKMGLNNNSLNNNKILNFYTNFGEYIYKKQNDFYESSKKDFMASYNILTQYQGELDTTRITWENDVKKAKIDKDIAVKNMIIPIINQYRNEIYNAVSKWSQSGMEINSLLSDFCIVNNKNTWIFGSKGENAILDNFPLNGKQLQRSSLNSLISPVNVSNSDTSSPQSSDIWVFITLSPNNLIAYDTYGINITDLSNYIKYPFNNDEVAYLITNGYQAGQNQYLVTTSGQLFKMSINGRSRTIKQEIASTIKIGPNDVVIIAGDNYYILSEDGKLNGQTNGDLQLKSCNSTDTYQLTLRNGNFIFQ